MTPTDKPMTVEAPWPPDATYRVHELMAQLAQKELECQRLREAAYLTLIRDDFERRMKARGHGSVAMSRLSGGEYMSRAVEREWEAEKRKYSPLRAPTHPPQRNLSGRGDAPAEDEATIPMARLIEMETAEHERDILRTNTQSLAMMLRKCAHRLKCNGHEDLSADVVGLLRRYGLLGSPLRGAEAEHG